MTFISEILRHLQGKPICTPETLAAGKALAGLLPDEGIMVRSYRTRPSGKIVRGKGLAAKLVYPKKARKKEEAKPWQYQRYGRTKVESCERLSAAAIRGESTSSTKKVVGQNLLPARCRMCVVPYASSIFTIRLRKWVHKGIIKELAKE